jgi:ribonuclease Z
VKSAFLTDLVNGTFGDPCLYVEIAWEGRALLFDLGVNQGLAPRRLLKVSEAFVSHAHINHFIGFDNLMRRRLAHEEPLRLFGPPELSQRVTESAFPGETAP